MTSTADRARSGEPTSPVQEAVWGSSTPYDRFRPTPVATSSAVDAVIRQSLEIARRHRQANTLYDARRKLNPLVLAELGQAGYWGLLIDPAYGGHGAAMRSFVPHITKMATYSASIAGLASVHGCIGAVAALGRFGSAEQRARFLPALATGERLSAFALTEPAAGSDLTALRTRAELDGDELVITGDKLFITNAGPGRIVSLVCLYEHQPAVVICPLPDDSTNEFQPRDYGLHPLQHSENRGLSFRGLRVPASNLIPQQVANGLTVAYYGLNRGRVALCAHSAGQMRRLLASMVAWSEFRVTYGRPIAERELVRRRAGRLGALIVGCDAMAAWVSGLLDQGARGEIECVVAKVFASDALRESAVELCLRTHGGRAFLKGHLVGDYLHDFLAPTIYEGEGDLLGLALFRALVKPLLTSGPSSLDSTVVPELPLPNVVAPFAEHARFAAQGLRAMGHEIRAAVRQHGRDLVDRQCLVSDLSTRVQKLTVLLATSLYASEHSDAMVRAAADVLCHDLSRELTGRRATEVDFDRITTLGESILAGRFSLLADVPHEELLVKYEPASAARE